MQYIEEMDPYAIGNAIREISDWLTEQEGIEARSALERLRTLSNTNDNRKTLRVFRDYLQDRTRIADSASAMIILDEVDRLVTIAFAGELPTRPLDATTDATRGRRTRRPERWAELREHITTT